MTEQNVEVLARLERALRHGASGELRDLVSDEWEPWPSPDWWESTDSSRTLGAICGLLSSTLLNATASTATVAGREAIGRIPMPAASPQDIAQLSILAGAYQRADASAIGALRGGLDRCVADLYDLRLSLLIDVERYLAGEPTDSA